VLHAVAGRWLLQSEVALVGPRAVFLAYGISRKYNGLRRDFAPHNENVIRQYRLVTEEAYVGWVGVLRVRGSACAMRRAPNRFSISMPPMVLLELINEEASRNPYGASS